MGYLLFIVYFGFCVFCLTRSRFIKNSSLTHSEIVIFFSLKIGAGLLLGWLSHNYYPENDYEAFNQDGIVEYNILRSDPVEFFGNIFRSSYAKGYGGLFDSIGSYWNDLRYNVVLKLLAVCNFFSRGDYYINSLLLNFLGFFGVIALFRLLRDIFPHSRKGVLAGAFLLPSTLYFASGIHKDLFIFSLLGIFFYTLHILLQRGPSFKIYLALLFSFGGIFLLRNYVAIFLLPVSACFWLISRTRLSITRVVIVVYGVLFLLLWTVLQVISPATKPLRLITQKKSDFAGLPFAKSQLNPIELQPTAGSFFRRLPAAINHGFLRPYLRDANDSIFLLPLAVELLIYKSLFIGCFFLFTRRKKLPALCVPLLLFALEMILLTGYIVPNSGSIGRYRSLYLPFLITPLLCILEEYVRERKILRL